MNDSHIHIVSDYECDTSYIARMGTSHNSNPSLIACYRIGHKVISLIDDSISERVYGNFLDEINSSIDYFAALLLDVDVDEGHTSVLMPPPVFSYA